MDLKVVFQNSFDTQEVERAKWVIEKAQRNSWNVIDTLVSHMVSRTLIEQLTGELPEVEKKIKKNKDQELREWVLLNLSKEMSPWQISQSLEVSYDTALKLVKENTDYFLKVKKGLYTIKDGKLERKAAKKDK